MNGRDFAERAALAFVVLGSVLACKLLQPSPKKVCQKGNKLAEKAGKKTDDVDSCVTVMTKLKKERPAAYKCIAKCSKKSDTYSEMNTCNASCASSLSSSGSSGTSTHSSSSSSGNSKVDALSSYDVKDKLETKYSSYPGYKLIKENNSSVGWGGSIMIGKKGGDAQIYKVLLADCSSYSEGKALAATLKRESTSHIAHFRVGSKKFLYIECMYANKSYSNTPGTCSYSDDRSDTMLDAVVGY